MGNQILQRTSMPVYYDLEISMDQISLDRNGDWQAETPPTSKEQEKADIKSVRWLTVKPDPKLSDFFRATEYDFVEFTWRDAQDATRHITLDYSRTDKIRYGRFRLAKINGTYFL